MGPMAGHGALAGMLSPATTGHGGPQGGQPEVAGSPGARAGVRARCRGADPCGGPGGAGVALVAVKARPRCGVRPSADGPWPPTDACPTSTPPANTLLSGIPRRDPRVRVHEYEGRGLSVAPGSTRETARRRRKTSRWIRDESDAHSRRMTPSVVASATRSTTGCSASGSSSSARRSTTTSPTRSPHSCCSLPPIRTRTSTCTSTAPAARSRPAWRSTTRCSSSRTTW